MKFNMTKAESALFIKRILCLTGEFTKESLIERFILKIGSQVEILAKEVVAKAYQDLAVCILEKYQSIEEFFTQNNLQKSKFMHYYLVEKMLHGIFKGKGGQISA